MSLDLRAISHVLNSPIYEKPWQTRKILSRLLGRGVFATEGAEHKFLVRPKFRLIFSFDLTPLPAKNHGSRVHKASGEVSDAHILPKGLASHWSINLR